MDGISVFLFAGAFRTYTPRSAGIQNMAPRTREIVLGKGQLAVWVSVIFVLITCYCTLCELLTIIWYLIGCTEHYYVYNRQIGRDASVDIPSETFSYRVFLRRLTTRWVVIYYYYCTVVIAFDTPTNRRYRAGRSWL